jgi:hypothetical protein
MVDPLGSYCEGMSRPNILQRPFPCSHSCLLIKSPPLPYHAPAVIPAEVARSHLARRTILLPPSTFRHNTHTRYTTRRGCRRVSRR